MHIIGVLVLPDERQTMRETSHSMTSRDTVRCHAKATTNFGVLSGHSSLRVVNMGQNWVLNELNVHHTPVEFSVSGGDLITYIRALIACVQPEIGQQLTRELDEAVNA